MRPRSALCRVFEGFSLLSSKDQGRQRTEPIAAWLACALRKHRAISSGTGLVFPSTVGTPLNSANLRNRVWIPLLERAQDRYRDMYSLR
jgi:hypothetical protein